MNVNPIFLLHNSLSGLKIGFAPLLAASPGKWVVQVVTLLCIAGLALFIVLKKRNTLSSGVKTTLQSVKTIYSSFFVNNAHKGFKRILYSPLIKVLFIVLLAGFFLYYLILVVMKRAGDLSQNQFVYLAESLMQGKIDIRFRVMDTIPLNGKIYSLFPPFPAILLMPFVAFFGDTVSVPMVSFFYSILSLILFIRILVRLRVKKHHIPWFAAAFFWGSAYWILLCTSDGVWFFAHIAAVFTMLLALNEVLGKGRGVLVGLFLGMAFLSRQLSIYFFLFLLIPLWKKYPDFKERWLNIILMTLVFSLSLVIYLGYNLLRFGDIFDTGYNLLPFSGFHQARISKYGQFHPAYIPFNFFYMFIQGFHIEFIPPAFLVPADPDRYGTAFLWASPFVIFSLWGRWEKGFRLAAWISTGAALLHQLMYFNNGWVQYNMQRFTMDFFPLLMILVVLGAKRFPPYLWKFAIGVAVALNILTMCLVELR